MKKLLLSGISLLFVFIVGCALYLNDYSKADKDAIDAFCPNNCVKEILDDGTIVYRSNSNIGMIFYPGGKVESTAYEPLMKKCAEKGITSILMKMPFNLAVLDKNAASGIQELYPEIDTWYMAGHSLGGAMASNYLEENVDDFDGIILLAAYSTSDLSKSDLNALVIYGSEDKVMNYEKYLENKHNLPSNSTEIILDGGNHAYFGMYGEQDGDGQATISNESQIIQTVNEIIKFVSH